MVYHIIILFCFVAVLFLDIYALNFSGTVEINTKNDKIKIMERKLFVLLVLYMIALCGFRAYDRLHHVGIDTNRYYESYLKVGRMQFANIINKNITDKGYTILQYILIKSGCEFWGLLLLSAVVYVGAISVYIYKYSKNPWMSVFAFVVLGIYSFTFSAVRQGIAMGICMIAYLLIDKIKGTKGFLLFVFLTWLASTMHASAIVFFPVYFLRKIPYKNIIIYISLGMAAVTMMFKNQFANLILQLAAETSDRYASYEIAESTSAGMLLYLFVLVAVFLKLIMNNGIKEEFQKDNSIYMILMMLILFPAVQSGGAMMRIYYYYYMFFIVYLPNVLESIEDKAFRQTSYLLLSAFLLYIYLTGDRAYLMLIPYQFFWQS